MVSKTVGFVFIFNLIRILSFVAAEDEDDEDCMKLYPRYDPNRTVTTMRDHDLVPDIIPVAPLEFARVCYMIIVEAVLGTVLVPTQTKDIPYVKWPSNSTTYCTLCMIDPDAPCRDNPTEKEWLHWLVVNIPGDDAEKGETIVEYVGACPPPATGLHRFLFLVYEQPQKLTFDEPHIANTTAKGRPNFSVVEFAKKYNLGNPYAGNFFVAMWDPYVDQLEKQLGKSNSTSGSS